MPDQGTVLSQLVEMSLQIGDPAADCVILGEGNTSARADDDTFWVKASGAQLPIIDESGFVRVAFEPVREMLTRESMTDDEITQGLTAASLDADGRRPSVETFFHAALLDLAGVDFVAHTHPTAVNALLCAQEPEPLIAGRLFPDEVVYCGPESAWVPYTDPGLQLARAVRASADSFIKKWNMPPRVMMIQSHGMIALGETTEQVLAATTTAVKAARVRLGAWSCGGIRPFPAENLERIFTRPDEHYRQRELDGR
jgi:rhamnose utilization protein RhaD (predicted bifunctional aldolase and dehydrogenase)